MGASRGGVELRRSRIGERGEKKEASRSGKEIKRRGRKKEAKRCGKEIKRRGGKKEKESRVEKAEGTTFTLRGRL